MSNIITIKVFDRDYTLSCPADQVDGLQSAAKLLDKQMREIQGHNKTVSLERIAVLAGLNIAHDLHLLNVSRKHSDTVIDRSIAEMNHKLDDLFDNLPR
ncbi:MAG: cell division protein ZapA [Arenimonas sp.]|nr:cell division protein ZapA [Arenimonas sp.]